MSPFYRFILFNGETDRGIISCPGKKLRFRLNIMLRKGTEEENGLELSSVWLTSSCSKLARDREKVQRFGMRQDKERLVEPHKKECLKQPTIGKQRR